ncbi:plakophilin-2 isoform X1 [Entelurus aequoreus]|uniref:plakophilin-2 isoform X1 n=1 Tax=Entelurus aequoreus TaxID=161455 RepID=UPI002B1E2BF5|nr:plakophilin-2 isoform X1 [Entelurus aequoreus]
MDDLFFKSVIPVLDYHRLDTDTSLALPGEPRLQSSAKLPSSDRSMRVQQQVQLTLLARKARKNQSFGSVHSVRTLDTIDGFWPNSTVNSCSLVCTEHVRQPSRRVEVSPPATPGTPKRHFVFNGGHFATMCTMPGRSASHRNCSLLGRPLGSHQRCALSEVSRWAPRHASTPSNQSPRVQSEAWFRGLEDSVFHEGGDEAMMRREKRNRLNSNPPVAMQMHAGWTAGADVPLHQIQSDNMKPPEMTLERAVNLLTRQDEDTLIEAAAHIQSQCLKSPDARRMVFFLRGIKKLLRLLHSDEEEVQGAAAGALRNVVYQSNENKMEVKDNAGVAAVLRVLKSSRDTETRRQLAGLLWNLSSHDLLKESLTRESLSVLTQSVLVPTSGISEGENPKDELLADEEVFHNATACLRNLSSCGPEGRKTMRECENLIDSLVYYTRGSISDYKMDDKSAENCVCILHNLSYQMEAELPDKFAKNLLQPQQQLEPKAKKVGCFAQRSTKTTEQATRQHMLLEEKANPHGMEWLWSSITIRMYLSLVVRSMRHYTQEAAIGALQNLTAGNGAVTEAIAYSIVHKESGLQHVRKVLQEGERDVRRTAVSLIKNLSRFSELHADIVKQVLPDVVELLPNNDTGRDLPSDVTASLCHVLNNLSQNNVNNVRDMLNQGALRKICNISKKDNGYGPSRAGLAACLLLHTMWKHTELHGTYRKCGFGKADFINARTKKAVNSIQD